MFTGLGRTVLLVRDQEDALAFYRDVLGFAVLHDQSVEGYRYLHIGVPGQEGTGLWLMPDDDGSLVGRQAGDHPFLVLYTENIDAVQDRLTEHDVEVWAQQDDRHSRSFHFRDLYGNAIIAAQLLS